MEETEFQRIVADEYTALKIRDLSKCHQCNRQDLSCTLRSNSCHQGIFCNSCLVQSMCKCTNEISSHPELIKLLHNTKIKCSFYMRGCPDILSYDHVNDHEASCVYGKAKSAFLPSMMRIESKLFKSFVPNSEQAYINRGFPSNFNYPNEERTFKEQLPSKSQFDTKSIENLLQNSD